MENLIDEKVAEGKLSLDNVMSIRFTRTIRNIMVPACIVGGGVLIIIFSTKKKISMDTLGSLDSVVGLTKSAISESSAASSPVESSDSTMSFSKITIMSCTEATLWAPIVVALSINLFAHGVLWLQNSTVGTVTLNTDNAETKPIKLNRWGD